MMDYKKYRPVIIAVVVTGIVYIGFKYLLPLIIPFVLAYFIAGIIKRPVHFFRSRFNISPMISGGVFSLLLTLGMVGGAVFIINLVIEQLVQFLEVLPDYVQSFQDEYTAICSNCDSLFYLAKGTTDGFLCSCVNSIFEGITINPVSFVSNCGELLGGFLITFIAVILIAKMKEEQRNNEQCMNLLQELRETFYNSGMAYLKVQGILLIIIALLITAGLFLLGNPYAALIGLGIAALDALPLIGSGIILVPWSIILFLREDYFSGIVLLIVLILCVIVREVLEPKLLGDKVGISSLWTLMSIWVGIRLFGIAGFVLGPVGLLLVRSIIKVLIERSTKEGECKA